MYIVSNFTMYMAAKQKFNYLALFFIRIEKCKKLRFVGEVKRILNNLQV